ncbi:hypothetical protein ACFO4E_17905 [Nocardiopsis mangrovi]|uniref:Uncharacterized protein n=1 Tax=Nocardiopsis mangrovi TaxID=1179818 RepID=A0ABV9DY09_9ACTN
MGRSRRACRVRAAVRVPGGSWGAGRRLLFVAGFVAGAWLLGASPAGADELPGPDGIAPAAEAVTDAPATAGVQRSATPDPASSAEAEPEPEPAETAGSSGADGAVTTAAPRVADPAPEPARPAPGAAVAQVASAVGAAGGEAVRSVPAVTGQARNTASEPPAQSSERIQKATEPAGADDAFPHRVNGNGKFGLGGLFPAAETALRNTDPTADGADTGPAADRGDETAADSEQRGESPRSGTGPQSAARSATGLPTAAFGRTGPAVPERTASTAQDAPEAPAATHLALGSAPQAQTGGVPVMFAGYLPAAFTATPAPAPPASARNALAVAPQSPVDEPHFSPD